ncbi:MAG TPA: Stp1/IreP family PP2C-type Ser/Thr phosphatase [Pyrinomonadaceae bacterium]|jgi:protein phosphatase|nr:Stp1/IreP family PP2C-type Ser/Thr phosphatase [Pyrinomonadaceae bacterium]
MTENIAAPPLEVAAITDRGLSKKRPLNEDSMLTDKERHLFVVADGVGGAQAGEVASKTAIETLEEAFHEHKSDEDAEDLLEIAIQRANDSIYRMSRENPGMAMMATTIVALHVNGLRATVGHVGDSRLYRLTPEGELRRETEDHSLVEEEVRAGRMTPEQAANHPGRNVISRALGAEASVEVDVRTFEIESGSTFLLCSDGITRHIPDPELSQLLRRTPVLNDACEEMKRLCYERGAEDNLTAVLVRVGDAASYPEDDEEPTLVRERTDFQNAPTQEITSPSIKRPFDGAGAGEPDSAAPVDSPPAAQRSPAKKEAARKSGGAGTTIGVLLLVLAAFALAFYVGMVFERKGAARRLTGASAAPSPTVAPTQAALEDPEVRFERLRRDVDLKPASEAARMFSESNSQPLNSDDPQFLYLYGRALLLTDRQQDASAAFDRALQKINESMTPRNGELKIDTLLSRIAARLRAGDEQAARAAAADLAEVIRAQPGQADSTSNSNLNANAQPSPGVSP